MLVFWRVFLDIQANTSSGLVFDRYIGGPNTEPQFRWPWMSRVYSIGDVIYLGKCPPFLVILVANEVLWIP